MAHTPLLPDPQHVHRLPSCSPRSGTTRAQGWAHLRPGPCGCPRAASKAGPAPGDERRGGVRQQAGLSGDLDGHLSLSTGYDGPQQVQRLRDHRRQDSEPDHPKQRPPTPPPHPHEDTGGRMGWDSLLCDHTFNRGQSGWATGSSHGPEGPLHAAPCGRPCPHVPRRRPEKLEPLWTVRGAPEPLSTKTEAYCPACRHPTVDVTTHRACPPTGSVGSSHPGLVASWGPEWQHGPCPSTC